MGDIWSLLEPFLATPPDSSARTRSGPHRNFQTTSGIRVIRVLPYLIHDRIACELRHLDPPPPDLDYRCLSYVWGKPRPCEIIYVRCPDGPDDSWHQFDCRRNLWGFFDYVRQAGPGICDQLWWADYLCLNQEDDAEKAVQVPRMGDIFSNARDVVIWLDLDEEQEQSLQNILDLPVKPTKKAFNMDMKAVPHVATFPNLRATIGDRNVEAVLQIFRHPYWKRIWTVQEVVLARKLWVITRRTPWMDARQIVNRRKSLDYIFNTIVGPAPAGLRMLSHRSGDPVSLLSIMLYCHRSHMQSTLAHDHIYALLGLAGSNADGTSPRDFIKIDYDKPCSEVLLDALFEAEHQYSGVNSSIGTLAILLRKHHLGHTGLSLSKYLQSSGTSARRKAAAEIAVQAADAAKSITASNKDEYCFPDIMSRELQKILFPRQSKCCLESFSLTIQERAVLVGLLSEHNDAPSKSSPWRCQSHQPYVSRGTPSAQGMIPWPGWYFDLAKLCGKHHRNAYHGDFSSMTFEIPSTGFWMVIQPWAAGDMEEVRLSVYFPSFGLCENLECKRGKGMVQLDIVDTNSE